VKEHLLGILKEKALEGVPIELLSTVPWFSQIRNKGTFNSKHFQRTFMLCGNPRSYCARFSDNWNSVDRIATDLDVFVILYEFEAKGISGFYSIYLRDRQFFDENGISMPTVYGYKTSSRKPVEVKDCLGTYYPKWRQKMYTSLLTPEREEILNALAWVKTLGNHPDRVISTYAQVEDALGETHLLTAILKQSKEAERAVRGLPKNTRRFCEETAVALERLPYDIPDRAYRLLFYRYPLIKLHGALGVPYSEWGGILNGSVLDHWLHYIQLCDRERMLAACQ